jgi:uncharacterized protein (DUF983 family)
MLSISRLAAILSLRCPFCFQGAMFRGAITMNEKCAVCGHRFMREPGFFQGAMYVSYVMGIATFTALLFGARALLQDRVGLPAAAGMALVVQMLLVPVMFRYSRVIWAHLNVGTMH